MAKGLLQASRALTGQTPTEESFSSRLEIDTESGCWEWQATFSNGKPKFYARDWHDSVYAVRWAYENYIWPIPKGGRLVSKKGVCIMGRRCANPWHFQLVTRVPKPLPLGKDALSIGTQIHRAIEASDSQVEQALTELNESEHRGS